MRIGVGLHLLAPDNGGVTNYTLTLLRLWPEYVPEHPLILFSFPHNDPLLATLPPAARRHEFRLRTQEDALRQLDHIDVYFCPFGTLWPRPFPKPTVLTFHDMQERFFPDYFTDAELAERFFHYDASLRMADAVITISRFTQDMATELTGIPRAKTRVVHHVPDELPAPDQPLRLPKEFSSGRFFFYPANLWRHKNHRTLLQGFAAALPQNPGLKLVCTGSLLGRDRDWAQWVEELGLSGHVIHLGKVSRQEISWLFQHALSLIFPSLFEGFGIPLIEAMQSRCPIACGSNTSQAEVAGNAALYFQAEHPASIAKAITRLAQDVSLRERLIQAGSERLKAFTRERFLQGHLDAFRLAQRRHSPTRRWINENIHDPISQQPRHALTEKEKRVAASLLRERSRLPASYDHVFQ